MINRITAQDISMLPPNHIFVFGSNEKGIHGAGAAKIALDKFNAKRGVGYGLQGQSFAIPTKDRNLKTLSLAKVKSYVNDFTFFARTNPNLIFKVTKIGTGLAGFKVEEIAPLFEKCIEIKNVHLPIEFWDILNERINV